MCGGRRDVVELVGMQQLQPEKLLLRSSRKKILHLGTTNAATSSKNEWPTTFWRLKVSCNKHTRLLTEKQ